MTDETYATRIRREALRCGSNWRNRHRLYRYMCRSLYGTRPGRPGLDRYKAAAKAAFGGAE